MTKCCITVHYDERGTAVPMQQEKEAVSNAEDVDVCIS